MSGNKKKPPELSLIQAKADLVAAKSCLSEAEKSTVRLAKYLRGQCGYHPGKPKGGMIHILLSGKIR